MRLLTVGHGTLDAGALAGLLTAAGVGTVVDVRRYPGSRRHPHVNRERMAGWLAETGIGYRWEEDLGGRRSLGDHSPHHALRVEGFRAYADHMETPAFRAALGRMLDGAASTTTAVLCAESLWWRCHRRLLADAAALLHAAEVDHLRHDGSLEPHRPTDGVRVAGDRLVYDVGADRPLDSGGE